MWLILLSTNFTMIGCIMHSGLRKVDCIKLSLVEEVMDLDFRGTEMHKLEESSYVLFKDYVFCTKPFIKIDNSIIIDTRLSIIPVSVKDIKSLIDAVNIIDYYISNKGYTGECYNKMRLRYYKEIARLTLGLLDNNNKDMIN